MTPIPTDGAQLLQLARWIGMPEPLRARHAPLFRREFSIAAHIRSARLAICGLGCHEAFINGQRVGDHVLDPAQTDYDIRTFFVMHDVTRLLRPGANTLGVMLGDGWFNQDLVWRRDMSYGTPRLIATLEVHLKDGSRFTLITDEDWRCARGPITSNNLYAGENYDARLEQIGWNENGFDTAKPRHASQWFASEIVPPPGGRLEEQTIPPMKTIEEIRPRTIHEPQPGYRVVDMGQNFSGWARIRVTAPAGTCIRLRFAEALFENGMVDTASTGVFATGVEQIDTYICKGGGPEETWEPRFTYHGFRYIEIVGWPGPLPANAVTGIVVHTALATAGAFTCPDERLNQLQRMALWTHRSNLHGFPEDCPARERCGWLGDAHLVCDYSFYTFSGAAFWEKYLGDIETTRHLNGGLPLMIAPGRRSGGAASPDWMVALILIPWSHYVFYGNRAILERHWDGMLAVMAHLESLSVDGLLPHGLGDWFDPGVSARPRYTPPVLTSTLLFGQCARIMVEAAALLGHQQEARRHARLADAIRAALHKTHYNRADHTFGSQTADAMALQLGFAPPGEEQAIADHLACDARDTHALHVTTGIMGIRYLFEALTRHGHGDVALALMHQDSYPSFGDLIRRGATTLWEYWGEAEVDARHGARSLNHPMFAGYGNWFFNTLAGIRPDPGHPGFKRFFLEPHPVPGLQWVNAHHDCPHGRIVSNWKNESGKFSWEVTVPQGTVALARLPWTGESLELAAGDHKIVRTAP
ncbi:alpha-L-rhamnosidase [Opitutaceae bacterium TAV1]|nr:alpha-L-rhamnosidase [Opitutaceae bacterium TAV1]